MADQLTSATVICQGGLDSTENHLFLDTNLPGGASRLINYEVGLYGGYRRINGYQPFDVDFPTVDDTNAEGKILGLAIYTGIDGTESIFAARKQKASNTYKFYKYALGVGWTAVVTGITHNTVSAHRSVTKIRHHKVSIEGVSYIIFVDGVNSAVVYDGANWYRLQVSGTGTAMSPGGDQLLDAPQYVTSFENHIFLSGDYQYPDIVCHSAPLDPLNFTVASGGGQLNAAYQVDGIRPFREDLYIFGNQRIRKITVDGTDFVIKDVAQDIGVIAPDSIIEMNGDILFLAQDGVRTISGTNKIGDINLASLSKQVQQLINTLQDNYDLNLLNSTVIKKKSQFRYFISGDSTTALGVGMIGGLRTTNGQTGWEFGELSGIRTSVVENDYINDMETTIHGDYDGAVYVQETGRTFNGTPIISVYSTPYLTFGDVLSQKTSRKIHTFFRPEGTLSMSVQVSYNWNSPYKNNPMTYPSDSLNSIIFYDDPGAIYDSPGVVYDNGDIYPVITNSFECAFNLMKITYTTAGDYEPHTIQGFIVEFNPEGTRTLI